MLVLNGLTLTNTGGETTATAPIVCGKSTDVHIVVAAGPTIDIKQSVEGIEAATLNFYSGDISVLSTDDCVNVANSDLSNYPFSLSIYGGQGFGRPWGTPPAMPFGGQPDWQQFTPPTGRPGGWQGVQPPGDQGGQPADSPMGGQMGGWGSWQSAILSEGSVVTVQDSSGNILYSGTALCNAGYVVFSSPSLISGSSYCPMI